MSVQTGGDVAGFAAEVRQALSGFSPEQVDDLTDGLEADLAEALADAPAGSDPISVFGTPEEYAAELGAAAGLEPGTAKRRRRRLPEDVRHPVRALRWFGDTVLGALRRRPWWPPVEAFLVAVRPAWWVLRGWVVYQLAFQMGGAGPREVIPAGLVQRLWLVALVVLSVQWGRGQWQAPGRWRALPAAVGAFAALAAIPVLVTASGPYIHYVYQGPSGEPVAAAPQDGVYVDGMQVSNLFVYDAQGDPLDDVQIYDDRGRPVRTVEDGSDGQYRLYGNDLTWSWVPAVDEFGQERWNAYPLLGASSGEFVLDEAAGRMVPGDGAQVRQPPRPFAKAPAIVVPGALTPDTSPTPSTPDAGPTSVPPGPPAS